jgi:dihydroxyacetone kinase-like protein
MGMALTSCTVPLAGRTTFDIEADQMEIGIGIHGEPGRERRPLAGAREIMAEMAKAVIDDLPFKAGNQVIAMVNGMGATPLIELYIAYQALADICAAQDIAIVRRLVGNYITSLEMAGCSITLVRADTELLGLWDAPVLTPGLRWGA